MSVENISSASSSPAVTNVAPAAQPKKILDQDDFMKLLVAQFTTQDPLNPQADMNSISQMATFTSLEQTKVMQADIALLQSNQELVTANSLIGREVTIKGENGAPGITGLVSGVDVGSDSTGIIIDGIPYPLSEVLGLAPNGNN